LTDSRTLLNFKVIHYRSRSRWCFCVWRQRAKQWWADVQQFVSVKNYKRIGCVAVT